MRRPLKLDPKPEGVFSAIGRIKEELDVNVELASPADFLPELGAWRNESRLVGRFGPIEVRHYDFRAQMKPRLERFPRIDGARPARHLDALCGAHAASR